MNRAGRRALTREWEKQFDEWRWWSHSFGDKTTAVDTIEMFQDCDDKVADAQVVFDVIEHTEHVEDMLQKLLTLARKAVIFLIRLEGARDRAWWEESIGKYFHISSTEEIHAGGQHRIVVYTAPVLRSEIGNPVAAGTPESRWDNVVANCRTISKRAARGQVTEKRCIIACYGPSLTSHLHRLAAEAVEEDAVIVSVSGSHDYLINNGIVPDYHVECDPRAHKALNINLPQESIQYLLGDTVHPELIAKLQGYDVALWHISCETNYRLACELEPTAWFVGGGGNVGLRAIPLLYEMGHRDFSIYGMDCSFSDDGKEVWAGPHASKSNPKEQKLIGVRYGDKVWVTSPIYLTYANNFFDVMKVLDGACYRMYGDGLLQAMCARYAWLAAQEQEKMA